MNENPLRKSPDEAPEGEELTLYDPSGMKAGQKFLDCVYPLIFYLVMEIAVSGIMSAALLISGNVFNNYGPADFFSTGNGNMVLNGITNICIAICMIFLYRADLKKRHIFRKWTREPLPKGIDVVLAVIMGVGASVIINFIVSLTGLSELVYKFNPSRALLTGNDPFLEILVVCILAPIAEEMLFRVCFFGRLRKYMRFLPAALISAAFFGLIHLEPVNAISAFGVGIVAALLYERTGSIFTSMIFHAGFNAFPVFADISGFLGREMNLALFIAIFTLGAVGIFAPLVRYVKHNYP